MALSVGSKAPDFELVTKNGDNFDKVKLSDNFGKKNTVLLFVPAAFSGVCTEQLCEASTNMGSYGNDDSVVYAISPDQAFAQEAWAKESGITIPLLSDFQKEVSQAYDVVLPDFAGMGPGSQRAAFVIDKEGVIRYADQTPTPLQIPDAGKVREALGSL